jgi:tight adherence protein C
MTLTDTTGLTLFVAVSSAVLLFFLVTGSRRNRLEDRLGELGEEKKDDTDPASMAQLAQTTLPKIGLPLLPKDEAELSRLQRRLMHAGFYSRQALLLFLGVKMLVIMCPIIAGVLVGLAQLWPLDQAVLIGVGVGGLGMFLPGFWLGRRKAARQTTLRRALPDALDVLVICLDGGLSLPAALRRMSTELRSAHPNLAMELAIAQREIQLGRTAGEALRQLGDRTDMEEMRTLASVIMQSERFGAGLVRALRVHSEGIRNKRMQRAEELAQKAATKMLFPTLLFIFPGVFIVVLAPAVIKIFTTVQNLRQ